jgi:hypothetical protein
LQRLCFRRQAGSEEARGFFEQAFAEHAFGALVDARVELAAIRIQADFQNAEAAERFAGTAFGTGEFDGADQLLLIVGMDAGCSSSVDAAKKAMQSHGAPGCHLCEPFAEGWIALRSRRKPVEERAQIEAGTAGENRDLPAAGDAGKQRTCEAGVGAGSEFLVGVEDIY